MIFRSKCFQYITLLAVVFSLWSCISKEENAQQPGETLFQLLPVSRTNINFENTLTEGPNTNVLMYEYFYNGGGVAVGDVNGDGLEDIYFSANMVPNQLYLNRGALKFEDITDAAGVGGRPGPWKTGVTFVDINGDDKLDIFVSYSGKVRNENRLKQLFINQGNENGVPRFIESASQFGIVDSSYTTQAVFFDYDLDNDLDLFLLNHNPDNIPILDEAATAELLKTPSRTMGSRLLRNDDGKFLDVTESAGISSSALSYGLGAAVSDINSDGWPDLYVSNDYSAPDYLYINNKKGGFTNELEKRLGQISNFSMGNNISDVNNDGLPDIFTLDMLPESNARQKLLFSPDNYEKFNLGLRSGFYYQYMRNMWHVNNGNGTFSEVAQFAGISNTDWSWAPLFADFDNDGLKDLFVTNGFTRDFTNMDFMKYMGDFLKNRQLMRQDIYNLVQQIPSSSIANYIFRNNGGLQFENKNADWGFDSTANSNGAAYADLDNDGDLDLIINNINKPAFIYENKSNNLQPSPNLNSSAHSNSSPNSNSSANLKSSANSESDNGPGDESTRRYHYLKIQLKGTGGNTQGLGAKLWAYSKGQLQFLEQMPNRGYQSVVSPVLHFGLRDAVSVDSLRIVWPGGNTQLLLNVKSDQLLTLKQSDALEKYKSPANVSPLFKQVPFPTPYTTANKEVNDFKRQPLMVLPQSFNGPCFARADVNGDGRDDLFAGGNTSQPGAILLQSANGAFIKSSQPALETDKNPVDGDAVFFDANGDGYPDLYVTGGGYHNYSAADPLLQDRLYLNDGKGTFTKSAKALPVMTSSKSTVAAADVNGDGSIDLFVGGRVIPGRYPETPESYLLINDGKGNFTNQAGKSEGLSKIGMVTDAIFLDLNDDKASDLVVAGEWMPLTVFINEKGVFVNRTNDYVDKQYNGWWNKLDTADLDNDGKPELIAGNFGLNSQIRASEKQPAELFYKDFDDNGAVDPILCCYIQGKSYPYVTRDELLEQISMMRTKFIDYQGYANTTLTDLFDADQLKDTVHLTATTFETGYFSRKNGGKFTFRALPPSAQLAPVYAIAVLDFDNDGAKDIILGGNISRARLRLGKSDANFGLLLKGDGKGNFIAQPQSVSGLSVKGDTRSIIQINNKILFGVNQHRIEAYVPAR